MPNTFTSAADIGDQLHRLYAERALAVVEGLDAIHPYTADLDREIAFTRSAYVGAAVSEIAILRGDLHGRLYG